MNVSSWWRIREYCFRCNRVQMCKESRFSGGWRWVCCRCGYTVEMDFDDEEDE